MNNTAKNRRSDMPIKIGDLMLYDVLELSKKLNVTPVTLRSYMKQGRLQGKKVGGKWYISQASLEVYFNPKSGEK